MKVPQVTLDSQQKGSEFLLSGYPRAGKEKIGFGRNEVERTEKVTLSFMSGRIHDSR